MYPQKRVQEAGRKRGKGVICRKNVWKEIHTKMASEVVAGAMNIYKFLFLSLLCVFCNVVMILLLLEENLLLSPLLCSSLVSSKKPRALLFAGKERKPVFRSLYK